jgi:hypothetical protein
MTLTSSEEAARTDGWSRINVIQGGFKVDVVPGVFFVRPGQSYQIKNYTTHEIEVSFPPGTVTERDPIVVGPDGCGEDIRTFQVAEDATGVREYRVRVKFSDDPGGALYASGGSNPRIVFK